VVILAPSLTKEREGQRDGRRCARMSLRSGKRNKVRRMHGNYEHGLIRFIAKKGASTGVKQPESVNAEGTRTSTTAKEMQTTASGYDGIEVAAMHAEDGPHKEEKDAKSNEGKLHKLKDKLFKH
jgi:hypothetical protein